MAATDAEQLALLIQRMYDPRFKNEVSVIDRQLSDVQPSMDWPIAIQLIQHNDTNVRFFGVQCFLVRISQAGDFLDEGLLKTLLGQLLFYLVTFLERNETFVVLEKLLSTLVAYFIVPKSDWKYCIKHVAYCMHQHRVIAPDHLQRFPEVIDLLQHNIASRHLDILLLFITELAEGTRRYQTSSQKKQTLRERTLELLPEVEAILGWILVQCSAPGDHAHILQRALQCYNFWLMLAQEEWGRDELAQLQALFDKATFCVLSQPSLENAAEFSADILADHPELLKANGANIFAQFLQSPRIPETFKDLEAETLTEEIRYLCTIILEFGRTVLEKGDDFEALRSMLESIMPLVHRITSSQSYDSVDQLLSNSIIAFWEAFVAYMENHVYGNDKSDDWVQDLLRHLLAGLEQLIATAVLPIGADGEFESLPTASQFSELRAGVLNVINDADMQFLEEVFEKIVQMSIDAIASDSWPKAEVCLGALLSFDDEVWSSGKADALEQLFASRLFRELANSDTRIPRLIRERAVKMIGARHTTVLKDAQIFKNTIETLFRCLDTTDPIIQSTASTALAVICRKESGRLEHFVGELTAHTTTRINSMPDDESVEDLLIAICAVCMEIEPFSEHVKAVEQLFTIIDNIREVRSPIDGVRNSTVTFLERVIAIVKTTRELACNQPRYQQEGSNAFAGLQSQLTNVIYSLIQELRGDGYILELVCNIFGGPHPPPGIPFYFDRDILGDLIISTPLDNPRLDIAFNAAGKYINSNPPRLNDAILTFLKLAHQVVRSGIPGKDPEIACALLDFVNQIDKEFVPDILIGTAKDMFVDILAFSTECITRPDALPKQAASLMWQTLLSLNLVVPKKRSERERIMEDLGKSLVQAIMYNVGGTGRLDDVRELGHLLRKVVYTQSSKIDSWMEDALSSPDFPGKAATVVDKKRFIAQIKQLRGGYKTVPVTEDFWRLCRRPPPTLIE